MTGSMSPAFLAATAQERSIVAAIPDAIQQKWLVRSASRPRLMRTEYSTRSFSFMEAIGSTLFGFGCARRRHPLPAPVQISAGGAPVLGPMEGCDWGATVGADGDDSG